MPFWGFRSLIYFLHPATLDEGRPHAAPAAKHFPFLQVRFGLDLGEGGENQIRFFFCFSSMLPSRRQKQSSVADLLCSV